MNENKLIISHFIKLALKWGYEKTENKGILKYHKNVFDRKGGDGKGIVYERLYITEGNITYQKFTGKIDKIEEIIDYLSCSARYINKSNTFINYIF